MGEIRSTFDIIMEKTKGLTMSEDEKEALQKRETEGRVCGFLQKYIDGAIELDRLKADVAALGERGAAAARAFLRKDCLARIELGAENSRLLRLLQDVLGLQVAPIRQILSTYEDEVAKKKAKREKEILKCFKKRGISGSALIPHLEADAEWRQFIAAAEEGSRKKLAELA